MPDGGQPVSDDARRATLVGYFAYQGGDNEAAHRLYHDDAIVEFPQSGERFIGKPAFQDGGGSTGLPCATGSGGSWAAVSCGWSRSSSHTTTVHPGSGSRRSCSVAEVRALRRVKRWRSREQLDDRPLALEAHAPELVGGNSSVQSPSMKHRTATRGGEGSALAASRAARTESTCQPIPRAASTGRATPAHQHRLGAGRASGRPTDGLFAH
jgi:hypothetical protein